MKLECPNQVTFTPENIVLFAIFCPITPLGASFLSYWVVRAPILKNPCEEVFYLLGTERAHPWF
jgi:hypothetical protein